MLSLVHRAVSQRELQWSRWCLWARVTRFPTEGAVKMLHRSNDRAPGLALHWLPQLGGDRDESHRILNLRDIECWRDRAVLWGALRNFCVETVVRGTSIKCISGSEEEMLGFLFGWFFFLTWANQEGLMEKENWALKDRKDLTIWENNLFYAKSFYKIY